MQGCKHSRSRENAVLLAVAVPVHNWSPFQNPSGSCPWQNGLQIFVSAPVHTVKCDAKGKW